MTVVTKSFILKVTGLLCPTLKRIDKFRIICLFKINKRNTNNVSNMFKNNKDTGTILLTFVLVFLLLSLNIFRTLFYWYNSWIWTNTAGPKKLVALDKKNYFLQLWHTHCPMGWENFLGNIFSSLFTQDMVVKGTFSDKNFRDRASKRLVKPGPIT